VIAMEMASSPRERLLRHGAQALSDEELLAVLLRNGCPGRSALEVACGLLKRAGGLPGLLAADRVALGEYGASEGRASIVLAALEVTHRLRRARLARRNLLSDPAAVAHYLALRLRGEGQEILGALYLDARNRLSAEREIFRGTLTRAAAEPAAILKEAIRHNAARFIVFHNHLSGDPTPSKEDLAFTRRLAHAASIVDIGLADHVILGEPGQWVSLGRRGVW